MEYVDLPICCVTRSRHMTQLFHVSLAEQYRLNALECAREAARESSRDKKNELLRAAESWIMLAENEEWLDGTIDPSNRDSWARNH
jgi:hypothetical protein